MPVVRPGASTATPEVIPFHTKDGATLWLTQSEIDALRLREFASEETGEIAYLAACDIDGNGGAHYPPAHIPEIIERLEAEKDIRRRCERSRKDAKDGKGGR